jgi:HPt (histidine-containing phosphotransfer) domain-containing protein
MLSLKETPRGDSNLLDLSVLDQLREVFGERTEILLTRTRQMVCERMAQMADEEPGDRLARIAHEVAGMAGQVGMVRLSREALDLERMCRSGDADAARRAAGALRVVADRSLEELPAA